MPRKIPADLMERAVQVYVGGRSALAAGAEVGVSECALLRALKKRGIDVKTQNRHGDCTEADVAKMAEMYKNWWPTERIATEMSRSRSGVQRVLQRFLGGEFDRSRKRRNPTGQTHRYCSDCEDQHDISEFHGLEMSCRTAINKYGVTRRNNSASARAVASAATLKLMAKKRDAVAVLKRSSCSDCGSTYEPFAMEFDHIDSTDKISSVAGMVAAHAKMDRILDEIKKTELVCVLCHRNRTEARVRSLPGSQSVQAEARRRGLEFIRSLKRDRPCADCGEVRNPWQMDFDHRAGEIKLQSVSRMTNRAVAAIEAEVAKCDVVCALCHRRRTHQRKQYRKVVMA